MNPDIKELLSARCHGGLQKVYEHWSKTLNCQMKFGIFFPSAVERERLPLLYFLGDFGANELTVFEKTDIQRFAEQYKIIVLAPDTSPRGRGIPGDTTEEDFGTGASFYLDAIIPPFSNHYRMHTYLTTEFRPWIERKFSCIDPNRTAVTGLGMGGNGALVCFLRNPQIFKVATSFAPIANPSEHPSGQKCFEAYLGPRSRVWREFDATELVRMQPQKAVDIWVDVGLKDQWSAHTKPLNFINACQDVGQSLIVKERMGYDNSMFFVKTFIGEHMEHFRQILYPTPPGPSY